MALAATAALTASSLPAAQPAQADVPVGPILGVAEQVVPYAQKVATLYSLYKQYVLGAPSELDQIKALIQQSQTEIVGQIDAIATAGVNSEARRTVEQFESIDSMSPDALAAFVSLAVATVEDAAADLNAEQTAPAQDELGFDLSIVGPIALAASFKAGQATDILTTDLIQANQTVIQKLTPQCGVFAFDLSFTGPRLAKGDCFAYDSNVKIPTNPEAQIPEFFKGVGFGQNDWSVTGNYDGFDFTAPKITDYSEAIATATAATSYPIAQASLLALQPAVRLQTGAPVAMVAETATNQPLKPLDVFGVSGAGNLNQGTFQPDTSGHQGQGKFSGFSSFNGEPQMRSVATAVDYQGRTVLFATDRIGQVWYRYQTSEGNDNSWMSWAQMPGSDFNSISVTRNHDGALQLFATNSSGQMFTNSQLLGGDIFPKPANAKPALDVWGGWQLMGGGWMSQVVAVTDVSNVVELFGLGIGGVLYHREQRFVNTADPAAGIVWSGWTKVNGAPTDLWEVTATTNSIGRILLTATTGDRKVFDVLKVGDNQVDADYSKWAQIPGTWRHMTAAVEAGPEGFVQMIGLDPSGNIFRNDINGGLNQSTNTLTPVQGGWAQIPGNLDPANSGF
ncbi:hypothetical protein [Streptomyces sp. NPDC046985]|uniref:hypothetical protein n=1 Tax=Streptomyces sp. NPDC046985 TaxID=3155377 RepID=UPI0033F41A3F